MGEFEPFPKIARLNREIIITEKIDGTNAQVFIDEEGNIKAGSRKRWLEPTKQKDNFGFATWVENNKENLLALGPGRHFGEWWGSGIQRGYGLEEKRFSLFNTDRWYDPNVRPACCDVVHQMYRGDFSEQAIVDCLEHLRKHGSLVAKGFMKPEGIIIYHTAARQLFKVTLEDDEKPKGQA